MKKTLCLISALLIALMLFAGCSAGKSTADMATSENSSYDAGESESYDMSAETPAEAPAPAAEEQGEYAAGGTTATTGLGEAQYKENDRKLIYTSNYSMETKEFEADYAKLLTALDKAGGFISNEETRGKEPEEYGDYGRSSYFTFRVPMDSYNEFLSDLGGVGSLLSKSKSTEDVTANYYDNEARIELYQAHYDKLMGYLEKATEMEDILTIESQINDTLYTLDELKGNKRYLDDRIDYCTVNVELTEVVEYSDVVTSKQTLGDRISESLTGVLKWLGRFFEGFAVVFIAALPVLAIIVVIFLAIFLPVRASKRKKAAKKAAQLAAQQQNGGDR